MSDYNPTYTHQRRDYEANRLAMEKYRLKMRVMEAAGKTVWDRLQVTMPKTIFITEQRPNPLSMELRIVLNYFWVTYLDCLKDASRAYAGSSEVAPVEYMAYAREVLATVRDLCFELFSPATPHAPFHIHSMYGCNNADCPLWGLGYEAAQEDVNDWYTPDC